MLGYRRNGAARILRKGRSRALGFTASYVTNPTHAAVVLGASHDPVPYDELQAAGRPLIFMGSRPLGIAADLLTTCP